MTNEIIGRTNNSNMVAVEESASIAEIQAKMILARNFPRNIDTCLEYIKRECQNKELAEKATYEFPRGDSVVKGASIRLVECVARHWGNLLSGIKEITSSDKEATVKAYCWDLETNFADEKIFSVPYVRTTKKSGKIPLTDERDRYEVMANMAARRKRACMQAIIPQFVIDEAINACQETLENSMKGEDIETTKSKMLTAFRVKAPWITESDFETVCGKPFENISVKDIVKLRNLYNAISDGFVKPEIAFKKETETAVIDKEAADTLVSINEIIGGNSNGVDKG
jgi:hypothetical protein